MKKFKKSLVINVPEDEHHEASSPTQIAYKENKERPVFAYNEHTIASSVNNEDETVEYDRQVTCEQFTQFHGKNTFEEKNFDHHEAYQQTSKNLKYKKINVIEFEEFNLEGDKNKPYQEATIQTNNSTSLVGERREAKNNRRQFSIEIPENEEKEDKQQISTKFFFDIKSQISNKPLKQSIMKQPPAPSNKSKITKTLNRHFVFPTNDQDIYVDPELKKEKPGEKVSGKFISEQEQEKRVKEINQEWSQKLEAVNKSFQKERQQFYKQKSSMEKDLMIKDGQIEMLQKLITNRYSPKQGSGAYYHQTNQNVGAIKNNTKQDSYKSVLINEKPKGNLYVSDENISGMETVLLEKDLQINSLLEKINELNSQIDKKNNQLEDVKISLLKNQNTIESLRNQLFIYEKKEKSQKITKQFYKMKETLIQVQQSTKTPKSFSRAKWQEEIQIEKEKPKSPEKNEFPFRGIDDLNKRIESLKMNRIELESRGRIKSELGYPQTSKNKTKGTFDFKGKFYDRDRDFINQTRMY